jgi:hypothetical protein
VADVVVVLDQGHCRGSVKLQDLRALSGDYDVDVEGDGEAFARAAGARGLAVERRLAEGDVPDSPALAGDRAAFTVRHGDGADPAAILAVASGAGVRVRRLAPQGQTLEQAFLRLLGARKGD